MAALQNTADSPGKKPAPARSAAPPSIRRRRVFTLGRCAVAAILLIAAVLKAESLLSPTTANQDSGEYFFEFAVIELELLLGFWLLVGLWRRVSWLVALACFIALAFISLRKVLAGEQDCGCFGDVHVPPWQALILDAAVVSLLIWFRPPITGVRNREQGPLDAGVQHTPPRRALYNHCGIRRLVRRSCFGCPAGET